MRFDVKLFALADLGAQFERPARVFSGQFFFAKIVVRRAERRICHGQVRVQLNCALKQRHRSRVVALRQHGVASHRICLQRFQRWRGGLLNRRGEFVHRL